MNHLILALAVVLSFQDARADFIQEPICMATLNSGQVSWGGGSVWQPANIVRLCSGTRNSAQTITCFKRYISAGRSWSDGIENCKAANPALDQAESCWKTIQAGQVNWGGGTSWNPGNVLRLCEGSRNAGTTIACFRTYISAGRNWGEGIDSCRGTSPRSYQVNCAPLGGGLVKFAPNPTKPGECTASTQQMPKSASRSAGANPLRSSGLTSIGGRVGSGGSLGLTQGECQLTVCTQICPKNPCHCSEDGGTVYCTPI